MDLHWIVLGLGNPGEQYRDTRHNLGFRVLDRLAERQRLCFAREGELGRKAWTAEAVTHAGRVVLAKPRTYMNRAGRAGAALCRRFDVSADRMLVVYDDADLPLGRIRIRTAGGAGGHNGIRSLIDALGTDAFPRVRLGVRGSGRDDNELHDYVLEPFDPDEEDVAERLVALGTDAVDLLLDAGVEAAMNRFNGCSAVAEDGDNAKPND